MLTCLLQKSKYFSLFAWFAYMFVVFALWIKKLPKKTQYRRSAEAEMDNLWQLSPSYAENHLPCLSAGTPPSEEGDLIPSLIKEGSPRAESRRRGWWECSRFSGYYLSRKIWNKFFGIPPGESGAILRYNWPSPVRKNYIAPRRVGGKDPNFAESKVIAWLLKSFSSRSASLAVENLLLDPKIFIRDDN